jgi:hypothetical protein
MPLLIRIIVQRLIIFVFSFLAFLGINPNIDIPTVEEVDQLQEEQREIVKSILTPDFKREDVVEKMAEIEKDVENIVDQITTTQKSVQGTVENAVNIPQVENTETGIAIKNNLIDDVVVNIVCVNRQVNRISMTTGSGVIVSPSGLVLTNSHVANTFLFDDENSDEHKECSIRRENIPTYGFNAELVYLPADWLIENQSFFTEAEPRGSGENDYALLAITSNTNPALSLPESFDFVNFVTKEDDIEKDLNITVAAYPGLTSGVFEIDSNAKFRKVSTQIDDLVTFNRTTIDIISTKPNQVAKKGSSGGGVFSNGELLGLITTTDDEGDGTFANALTLPYIIRDFRNDTNKSFINFIFSDKDELISDFQSEESYLKSLIADFL